MVVVACQIKISKYDALNIQTSPESAKG